MRLPRHLIDSLALCVDSAEELIAALGDKSAEEESGEIRRLFALGLPPVTSLNALAVMTGYNRGFLWSLIDRPEKYYRVFHIPKGRTTRQIEAPKVALKFLQKWLSVHFARKWLPHGAAHGFVCGRSHISAARVHLGAEWVVSIDIENFFPSTPSQEVLTALTRLGYQTAGSIVALSSLCCYNRRLAQGAPSSPVLSNIALQPLDEAIFDIAEKFHSKFTRYADDIVLSGKGSAPENLISELEGVFESTAWRLSPQKRSVVELPQRLKVHGLLVHGEELRLTKGYRNRIRSFRHLFAQGRIVEADRRRIAGHLNYASQLEASKNRANGAAVSVLSDI
jgi:RNA-directed DNA polymerase